MDLILNRSLLNFKRETQTALNIITKKTVPAELDVLKQWLQNAYNNINKELGKLDYLISLKQSFLHDDILSQYAAQLNWFRFISAKYLPAIYRNHENDLLALKLLKWLHAEQPQTRNRPYLIQDGNFSILPHVGLPISYYLPVISQQGLLFLPLFFHELGHYLYQAHKPEMDALVKALQGKIDNALQPAFASNNTQAKEQAEKSKKIVETWYEWTQEFFCDAVGLEIGGRTYLKAFSYYIRMQGETALQVSDRELPNSTHPVSWLRIQFLVERARKLGLNDDANELEKDWKNIAATLNITEDYFGYYSNTYHSDLCQTVDDMVIEADPIRFADHLPGGTLSGFSFIGLLHLAWDNFETNPINFDSWETSQIAALIA